MLKHTVTYALALAAASLLMAADVLAANVTRDPSVPRYATPPPARAAAAVPAPNLPKLSAAQIVDKNVAARGGLAAWRAVHSMTITGKLDAGGKQDTLLPYTLQVRRPNMQRLAIEFAGHSAVQVFDGTHGWKLRPFMNRPDPEPFSPEELQQALAQPDLDGLLIDSAAKGSRVELEGTEMVDKQATYRLKVTTRQGREAHVWIDGKSFLEAKAEDSPHRFDGKMRKVETYYRDYRRVEGVMIPYVAETRVDHVATGHAMTIEKVVLNEKLDDSLFAKPASLTAADMSLPPRMIKVGPAAASPSPAAGKQGSH